MKYRYTLIAFLSASFTRRIRRLQREVSALTGARASLEEWSPHISIGSEVWLQQSELPAYLEALKQAIAPVRSFNVTVGPFGFIDKATVGELPGYTAYGMFLEVAPNPALQQLALAVKPVTDSRPNFFTMPWPFRPHVTIAFKDLDAQGFARARSRYAGQPFAAKTRISSISVAQKTETGRNREVSRLPLA